jgi:NAD(P)H-nitrite reductase large subunit
MLTREPRLIAIWTEAFRQGRLAGYNMAGVKKEYGGSLAMNSVEIGGVATISVGETDPQDEKAEILSKFEPEKKLYKKLVLRDNVLTGVILVNDIERAGIYTGLIRDKVNVSSFKSHLLREDFGVISLPKEYHKHLISGQEVLM